MLGFIYQGWFRHIESYTKSPFVFSCKSNRSEVSVEDYLQTCMCWDNKQEGHTINLAVQCELLGPDEDLFI